MTLEKLIGGIDFGEGPRWHAGRLWYSDFFQRGVFAVDLEGRRERILALDDQPSGLGWLPDGDLLVVSMTKRQLLRFDGEKLSVHADLAPLAPGFCNDLVVSRAGHAWVGNFGASPDDRTVPEPTPLIHVAPDGRARETGTPLAFPNGAVLGEDEETLVVGESVGGRYSAYRVEADGSLVDHRIWAETPGRAPDGCALDADGAIWFADAGRPGCAVVRIAEGGDVLASIETPDPTFACMLGGDDGRTLFVLTAPGSSERKAGGKGLGAIWTARVEAPGAGAPSGAWSVDRRSA